MRNHEVTKRQLLLDQHGEIAEPGWARNQIWQYRRSDIKAPTLRIKEWDYYLVLNDGFAGAFTIADNGYMGLMSVSLLCFDDETGPWEHTESLITLFPMGKYKLPETSDSGNTVYRDKRLQLEFFVENGKRRIVCNYENFWQGKPFSCDITLEQPPMDSMVIATPWDKKHAFYYNQKINCMRASGWMRYDGKTYTFQPDTDFGTLDWGRGVWTYDNTWYWGSGNCVIDGKPFGFNIGYGFGNTSAATENILFYDGKAHKLDDVTFHIPADDFCKPWTFSSSDGRFEMDFLPVIDRAALTDAKVLISDQHQVFGRMSGKAVLDDGTVLEVKDMMCFAEKVRNKY